MSIECIRRTWDYHERFEICLAAAFELFEASKKIFSLYDRISSELRNMGKKVFVPHKHINPDWSGPEIYDIVSEIIIPSSELVLADMGNESTAAGMMAAMAWQKAVPFMCFYRRGKRWKTAHSLISKSAKKII